MTHRAPGTCARRSAGCDPHCTRYPSRGSISVRAASTTSLFVSVHADHRSGATAGLSLAASQTCLRLEARLTMSPPFVRLS